MIGVVVNNTSLTLNFDVERQGCAAMKSLPWLDHGNTYMVTQLYTFETISDHLQYQGVRKRTLRIVYLCN